jgi:RHS repeat-associated protein
MQNGAARLTTTKTYDYLNRLTQISSVPSAGPTLSYSYQYNSANQRTSTTTADGSYWAYSYDALGQLTSGRKYWSDVTPVAGQQFTYGYDDIGNRLTASCGGDQNGGNLRSSTYSPNSVNQYSSRTVPGYVEALGLANSNATVTLWTSSSLYAPTSRKGQYFWGELAVNNSSALWLALTNLAVLKGGWNPDILTNSTGNLFVPPSTEPFSYDGDGNLAQDGRWQYTWDFEDRLISMQGLSMIPNAAKLKLDFQYDDKGRRIQKIVSTFNGSSYIAQSTNRYLYDGWNLLARFNQSGSLVQSYVWGSDLGGAMNDSGGIGGLLLVNDCVTNGVSFVACDGNGNVSGLVKAADGANLGVYEYGPFGEVIRATGLMAKPNPFRFSTKYQDDETDLLYYGYRFYSAGLGKWMSRDPAGEKGGLNVYGFVYEDPIDNVDPVGLAGCSQADILDCKRKAKKEHKAFKSCTLLAVVPLYNIGIPYKCRIKWCSFRDRRPCVLNQRISDPWTCQYDCPDYEPATDIYQFTFYHKQPGETCKPTVPDPN